MFTEKHFLKSIEGEELDTYLAKGWYRLGQLMFTCHFIFFQNKLYSPVWIRLPIEGYSFRKSARRLLQKVEQSFEVKIAPGTITDTKDKLYQIYRENFRGHIAPSLINSLQDDSSINIFNSKNVEVYHGKKLIAFSFFDVGSDSIASIKGVYDPAYSSYSLGLYTLLKEIEFGLKHGFAYFYPGYIVPGYDRFDYKLRIGRLNEIEYYNPQNYSWENYVLFNDSKILVKYLSKKLSQIAFQLTHHKSACQLLFYQMSDLQAPLLKRNLPLQSPLFLSLFSDFMGNSKLMVYFDVFTKEYVFVHDFDFNELNFEKSTEPSLESIIRSNVEILRTTSEQELVQNILQIKSAILPCYLHQDFNK